jgi:hypothetical protein
MEFMVKNKVNVPDLLRFKSMNCVFDKNARFFAKKLIFFSLQKKNQTIFLKLGNFYPSRPKKQHIFSNKRQNGGNCKKHAILNDLHQSSPCNKSLLTNQ